MKRKFKIPTPKTKTINFESAYDKFSDISSLLNEFDEQKHKNVFVFYPGRFHPFHTGHTSIYHALQQQFPDSHVIITTSDKVDPPNSPFTFDEKYKMMVVAGVDPDSIAETQSPYRATEVVEVLPENAITIFAISEKDMKGSKARINFNPKKDGSPSYLQPFESIEECKGRMEHGYVTTLPTLDFDLMGSNINSASELRKIYADADEIKRQQIIQYLYGRLDEEIYKIFNLKID
jgi:cytidyltransferase-like protein